MPEVSIRDQIKKLIELQELDKEIYEKTKEFQEMPETLEELKTEFESKKQGYKELEEKLKQIQVDRSTKEGELQQKEGEITKANGDLSQIKTNKEYTAKLNEIEHLKADKSRIEELVLLSYDEADAVGAKQEEEKKVIAEEEKKYQAQKQEIEASMKVLEDRVKVLSGQKAQLTPAVDKPLLEQYERLVGKKEGIAIVPVIGGNSCGGCHMNVTPQTVNLIKMHEEIVNCDRCSRILYIEDDL